MVNRYLMMKDESFFGDILTSNVNVAILVMSLTLIGTTIFLNMFIVMTVLVDRTMRNYTNVQFASMSLADMLVGSVAMPCLLISTLYDGWPLGNDLCVLWCISDFVGGNISILILTVISYHRLSCIHKPFLAKKSTNQALLPSLVVWPVVFLFWTLPIVLIVKNPQYTSMHMDFKNCYFKYSFEYVLAVDIFGYIIPICFLVYLQVSIYLALKKKKRNINPLLQSLAKRAAHLNSFREGASVACAGGIGGASNKVNSHLMPQTLPSSPLFSKHSQTVATAAPHHQFQQQHSAAAFSNSLRRKASLDECVIKQLSDDSHKAINQSLFMSDLTPISFTAVTTVADAAANTTATAGTTGSVSSTAPGISGIPIDNRIAKSNFQAASKQEQQHMALLVRKNSKLKAHATAVAVAVKSSPNQYIAQALNNYYHSSMTKNRKAFRTLFFVACSLIVFWMPWIIAWPIEAYCDCIPNHVYGFTYFLEYLNSFVNSLILIFGNQHFRVKFLKLVWKK